MLPFASHSEDELLLPSLGYGLATDSKAHSQNVSLQVIDKMSISRSSESRLSVVPITYKDNLRTAVLNAFLLTTDCFISLLLLTIFLMLQPRALPINI